MSPILRFAALGALALPSVYAYCDGSAADSLVKEIESFNSKLDSYASLVANSPAATTRLSLPKNRLFDKRAAAKSTGVKEGSQHFVKPEPQHAVANAKPPAHAVTKAATTQGHAQAVTKTQEQIHFSTYIPIEEQRHEALVRQSFESLTQQQAVLDSMQNACIPVSHKPKVISAVTKTLSLYLIHRKNLVAAESIVKRAVRPQAGWLTMGNDVNSGYNGDEAELTSSSSSSSTATPDGYPYGYPGFAGYPPPQYSPQYITVTVSPSTVNAPASTSTDSGDDSDDDDGSDDGSTSTSAAPAPAPAPLPTSPHHGILYESTIGLIVGSLHFVERLLGIGGSKQLVSGPTSDLAELFEKVANEYKVKV